MPLAIAACQIELPATAGSTLHLLPSGHFRAIDGRPYDAPSWSLPPEHAVALSEAIASRRTPRVIDYEHQTLNAARNGQPAPAAGWFHATEWRDDGFFATDVQWTDRAAAMIAAREYRYLSPVFSYVPETGLVVDILHVALTNTPALDDLSAVAASLTLGAFSMNEDLLERLRYLLNLPVTSMAPDIVVELQKLIDMLNAAQPTATTANRLGLPDWIAALRTATPDPAQYVPIAALTALQTELAALRTAQAADEVETLVTAALADGRLLPPLAAWARELGKKDIAELKAYLASAQPIAALTGMQTQGRTPAPAVADPKARFDADAALRAEFGDFETYQAYTRAAERGLATILRSKTE